MSTPYVLLIVVVLSFLVAVATLVTGQADPMDSAFWYLGLFLVAIIAGVFVPVRPWRGSLAVILPQLLLPFFPEPSNIWPLSLFFLGILLGPLTIAAYVGALIRRRAT